MAAWLLMSAVGARAHAQAAADEYGVIVLDQTGSMDAPGQDHGNLTGGPTPPFTETFDNALNAAINWVKTDRESATAAGNRRAYAVYTFKDDLCCLGTQAGLKKIWPVGDAASPGVGCQPGPNSSTVEDATGFCLFDARNTAPYDGLIGVLNSLRLSARDPNNLLSPIDTGDVNLKGGASFNRRLFGLGPNTPLANALCDAAERLVVASRVKRLTFTLETDGGENFSGAEPFLSCSGTAEGIAPDATAFNKAIPDWGMPPNGWQAHVMRRLTRFNQPAVFPLPVPGGLGANDGQDQSIIGSGPIRTPPDDVLASSRWRIDVHFAICDPAFPAVAPCQELQGAPGSGSQPGSPPKQPDPPPSVADVVAASARTQSISATELAFFRALGHVNGRSTFRQFVRDPAAASRIHVPRVPGDIDDSGCTDRADLGIVTQGDVYYQQAVQPNQIAIRADLNGDQWVNRADAEIVLANWGRGCINPVGPRPVLKF